MITESAPKQHADGGSAAQTRKGAAPLTWLLVASAILTTLFSGYSIWKRHLVEISNRTVTIATEYETAEALASAQGMDMPHALADLKAQGLSSVVLSEGYLGELIGA